MTPRQLISVFGVTAGVLVLVLVCVDWSPTALQDPARTLGLNAQGVVRWGETPNRAPFSVLELTLFLGVGLAFVVARNHRLAEPASPEPGRAVVHCGVAVAGGGCSSL